MINYRILLRIGFLSLLLLGDSCEIKKALDGPGGSYCFYSSADWYRNPNSHILYPIVVEINNSSDDIIARSSAGQFPNCSSLANLSHLDSLTQFVEYKNLEPP